MDRNSYNTKQRDEIIKFFNEHRGKCFTAKDIIKRGEINSGEATIYRTLSKLTNQGILTRFTDGEAATYRLNESEKCANHFHLKCSKCGILIHMDCDFMKDMQKHIESSHDFKVDIQKTIIYGICGECSRIGDKND